MNKWKFKKTEPLLKNIDALCKHYALGDEINYAIKVLCKHSYTSGHNDMYRALKDNCMLKNQL